MKQDAFREGGEGGAFSDELMRMAELDEVRSAVLLERSGRVREWAGEDDAERLHRAATLAAALHATGRHLGEATETGEVSRVVLPVGDRSLVLVPVPTRGAPLLLLLIVEGTEGRDLTNRLATFLEAMAEMRPEALVGVAEDLEASLLEGLERAFPRTDDPAD